VLGNDFVEFVCFLCLAPRFTITFCTLLGFVFTKFALGLLTFFWLCLYYAVDAVFLSIYDLIIIIILFFALLQLIMVVLSCICKHN